MFKISKTILLFVLLSFWVQYLQAEGKNANSLKKVSIQLNWKHQFEFTAFYMAKEEGFYKKVGLDVDIKEYKAGGDVTKDVLNGKSTFGVAYPTIILDKSNGKKVTLLTALLQSSPLVFVSLKSSGIKSIKDFKNKRVMINSFVLNSASISSMLAVNFIKPGDLKMVKYSFDIKDLLKNKADLYGAYISNELYTLDKLGVKYDVWDPKNYGFDFYDEIIFTSKNEIKKDPKVVKDFTKATLKGWEYALSHIDESVQVILKKYNTQHKSKDALLYEAKSLKKLAYYKDRDLGEIDKQKIKQIYDIYHYMGKTKNNIDFDAFIYQKVQNGVFSDEDIAKYMKKKKVVKICTNPDWNPIEFVKKDKPKGISIDTLDIILSKVGLKSKYVPTSSWSESQKFLKEKKCDVLPSVIKTAKREQYANFTKPYLNYKLLIITKKDKPLVPNIDSIIDKTMTRKKGSGLIDKLKAKYLKIKIFQTKDPKEAFEYVENGKAYFTISTLPVLSYYKNRYDFNNLQIAGYMKETYNLCMAVRNDDMKLLKILDKGLKQITPNIKNIIYDKWINKKTNKEKDYAFLYKILIVLFVIWLLFSIRYLFIQRYNKRLKSDIKKVQKDLELKQKQLLQQSRLAQMGEMISMIAHQWRQPLAAISAGCANLKLQNELETLNNKTTIEIVDKIVEYTQHLSKTIDDFMNFFKPNKEKVKTDVNILVDETLSIVNASIKNHDIKLIKDIKCDEKFKTYTNEVKQVLINLMKNAKDILVSEEIKEPYIKIKAYKEDENIIIEVSDNAGGVDEKIKNKIFDPYFSTKGKNGMGIGLYMSKVITEEHCKGKLEVKNDEKGAVFIVKLPIEKE